MTFRSWVSRLFAPAGAGDSTLIGTALAAGGGSVDAHGQSASSEGSAVQKFGIRAVVPAGMTVTGEIRSSDGVVIDGAVVGNATVVGEHRAILVRAGGSITGNVSGHVIVVGGEVRGDITCDFVRLYSTARVTGRIKSNRMVIDDGAQLMNEDTAVGVSIDGACSRVDKQPLALVSTNVSARP